MTTTEESIRNLRNILTNAANHVEEELGNTFHNLELDLREHLFATFHNLELDLREHLFVPTARNITVQKYAPINYNECLPITTVGDLMDACTQLPRDLPVLAVSNEHPWRHPALGIISNAIDNPKDRYLLIVGSPEPF